jgi:hypothetical protein
MTPDELKAIAEAVVRAELCAKHMERDHHLGCGYGSSVCYGEPNWAIFRTDIPALLAHIEEQAREIERLKAAGFDEIGLRHAARKEEQG